VRLVVEREREIQAFMPEEYWKVAGVFTTDIEHAAKRHDQWLEWLGEAPEQRRSNGNGDGSNDAGRTNREKLAWLAEHSGILTELVEVAGEKFDPKNVDQALTVSQLAGFELAEKQVVEDPKGKGPAATRITLFGEVGHDHPPYRVKSIQTKRTSSRPSAPFITSTMQQAAANRLGFAANTTMRTAQQLYEGVDIKGMGTTGLITYMRTDSTHLSGDAINQARNYINEKYGEKYLPQKPNFYSSSNKAAQEAHEAIRPTDVNLTPDSPAIRSSLNDQQYKLYRLIWQRFVSCQMTSAQWDSTTVLIVTETGGKELVFRGSGRTLVFDGFYKVAGAPHPEDEAILPKLEEQQKVAPIQIDPTQKFTSPPPRYTEASLVKKLEGEGIGRPSTYASIIDVIQRRKYVEKIRNRFHATDLGMVVTDKLIEGFPRIMDVGYTRDMEAELDAVEEQHHDWVDMLRKFYGPFRENLDQAHEAMGHAKAETKPAPYACAECGAETVYRFGKNGMFLSCSRYPDCKYAAPIDREGKPMTPQQTDIICPDDNLPMIKRTGRFGPFLASQSYPEVKFIVKLDPKKGGVVLPKAPPLETDVPCPKCEAPLNMRDGKRGYWLSCSRFPKCRGRGKWGELEEEKQKALEDAWTRHYKENEPPDLYTIDGKKVEEGYQPKIEGEDFELENGTAATIEDGYNSDAA
ncbi:MAG: DNA topoisomerase, partial [Rhodospirillales bacterium]|nr:DNA topoisomerase [Rhodospirillales bacterium]